MNHATESLWFWLLIGGLFLILLAALLGGGLKEVNGWVWGIFIAGAILAFLGIILGIVAWSKAVPCDSFKEEVVIPSATSSPMTSMLSVSSIPPEVSSTPSSLPPSPAASSTVTSVSTNVPQAQRGFATTNLNLSALSPP